MMTGYVESEWVRIELNIPKDNDSEFPDRWWDCCEWLAGQDAMPLSNKLFEFDEMRPPPKFPNQEVWWDHFDCTDRWSWYFPIQRKDLAMLFKLTFSGK